MGYYERAIKTLLTVEKLNADICHQLGRAQLWIQEFDDAIRNTLLSLQDYYEKCCDIIEPPDLVGCSPTERCKLIHTATPNVIRSLRQLSTIHWWRQEYHLARLYDDKVKEILPTVFGEQALIRTITNLNISQAIHLGVDQQTEQSEAMYKQTLSMFEEMYGSRTVHVDIALVLSNLGALYNNHGDYGKALEHSKKALEMYKIVHGETSTHDDIIRVMFNLGNTYKLQGDYVLAEEYYNKSLSTLKRFHGPSSDHRDIANCLHALGNFYSSIKQYSDAHKHLTGALDMYQRIYGTTSHILPANVLNNIGYNYFFQANYLSAIDNFNKALDLFRKVLGDDCPFHMRTTLQNIGLSYFNIKKYQQAEEYFLQVLALCEKVFGENNNHIEMADALYNLAASFAHTGKQDRSIEMYKQALAAYISVKPEHETVQDIKFYLLANGAIDDDGCESIDFDLSSP